MFLLQRSLMSFRCTEWKPRPACGLLGPARSALLHVHLRPCSPTALAAPSPTVLERVTPRVSAHAVSSTWKSLLALVGELAAPPSGVLTVTSAGRSASPLHLTQARPLPIPRLSRVCFPYSTFPCIVSTPVRSVSCLPHLNVSGGRTGTWPVLLIIPTPAPSTVPGSISVQSINQSIKTQWTEE